MNYYNKFDDFLLHKDVPGAFRWAVEKLAWDPDSTQLRGMAAFAFLMSDQTLQGRYMAEEVLKENPDEPWALAAVFAYTCRPDAIVEKYSFFDEGEFRLGHEWIARFQCLGHPDDARNVSYCLSRYGSPAQKARLSEDWLVKIVKFEPPGSQMELGLEYKQNRRAGDKQK